MSDDTTHLKHHDACRAPAGTLKDDCAQCAMLHEIDRIQWRCKYLLDQNELLQTRIRGLSADLTRLERLYANGL